MMKTTIKFVTIIVVVLRCLLTLSCTGDYNPFLDATNTKLVITAMSFDNGDTIPLFRTDTISVMIAVSELAESLTVEAPANRFFTDGIKRFTAQEDQSLQRGPYHLTFSMYDTGHQEIVLTLKKKNGNELIRTFNCYVTSPLQPKTVTGAYGVPCTLSAAGVSDNNIIYEWDFGRGVVIFSTRPETTVVLQSSGIGHQGLFRATDGYTASPSVPFSFILTDTIGPVIEFIDELYKRSKDTVYTSDTTFFFSVLIHDQASGGVTEASIDDRPFDIVNNSLYTMVFNRMDTLEAVRRIVLFAMDDEQYRNTTTRVLYLKYDPSISLQSGLRLLIRVPPEDNIVYTSSTKSLYGTLEHLSGERFSVDLKISVNGRLSESIPLSGKGNAEWYTTISLTEASNIVSVTAFNETEDSVASDRRIIRFESDTIDHDPPVIVAVRVEGKDAGGAILRQKTVDMRIIAFDAGSGMNSLTVNGKSAVGNGSIVWDIPVECDHRITGSSFTITAGDKAGLSDDTTVVLYVNHAPLIEHVPVPPLPLVLGTKLIDSIVARDPGDGDSLQYHLVSGDTSLSIDKKGIIRWKPEKKHKGAQTFVFMVSDGYEEVYHTMEVVIVEKDELSDDVAFLTRLEDFPAWIEAEKDTVEVHLRIKNGTGTPPFTYHAVRLDNMRYIPVIGDTLLFIPEADDTGYISFILTVTDTFERSDTLHPSILVVPRNRPCTVRLQAGFDTTENGAFDLSRPDGADTLRFHIDDPDINKVESFSASIRRLGTTRQAMIDSQRVFSVALFSMEKDTGYDTLLVRVTDRVGHRDSLTYALYYGTPPVIPVAQWPASDSTIRDSIVYYSWSGNDVDGRVSYTVLAAECPETFVVIADNLTNSWFTISGVRKSARYCWRIIASDGKVTVRSDVNTFILLAPDHVQFTTDETDFPPALEALRDSLVISLELVENTGYQPFTFSGRLQESEHTLIFKKNTIHYLPTITDTGIQHLRIKVVDSVGNSDTLFPVIYISPPNRPCSLAVYYHNQYLSDDTLDISGISEPDTIQFQILDPDTVLTEQHTVTVRQLNSESSNVLNRQRLISIILDPQKSQLVRDTVRVSVEDRAGHTATERRIIYYGEK